MSKSSCAELPGATSLMSRTDCRRNFRTGLLLIPVVVLLQACGGAGAEPGDSASPTATSPVTATYVAEVSTTTEALPPTPVAAWPLKGDGKARVGDLDLEFVGNYTMTADGVGFDGVTGKAMTEGPGPLDTSKSLTLSAWVSYTYKFSFVPIAIWQYGQNNGSVAIAIAGADWNFSTSDYDKPWPASGGANILAPPAQRSNEWVHVVGVSDREAGVIRFYFNGSLVDEIPANEPFAASGPLIIGDGWSGAIADVAIYQSALTSDQISALYGTTEPSSTPPEWTPDPATYADGILNGTWDYVVPEDELETFRSYARSDGYNGSVDEVLIRLFFNGPRWWSGAIVNDELWLTDDGLPHGDRGLISMEQDQMAIRGSEYVTTYQWKLDGDQLSIIVVEDCAVQSGDCSTRDEILAGDPMALKGIEQTFIKSGDDPGF